MNRTTSMSQLGSVDFPIESEQIPDSYVFHMGSGITSSYSYSNKPIEPAHFLDACRLCNRRLGHGRDIYMYRGDNAFCSVECREQQIAMDERKEKSAAGITGMKKGGQVSSSNRHENSKKGNFQTQTETVAAAWWTKGLHFLLRDSAILVLVKHSITSAIILPLMGICNPKKHYCTQVSHIPLTKKILFWTICNLLFSLSSWIFWYLNLAWAILWKKSYVTSEICLII